jgi:hypothetical protein
MTATLIQALGLPPTQQELESELHDLLSTKAQLELTYYVSRAPIAKVRINELNTKINKTKQELDNL